MGSPNHGTIPMEISNFPPPLNQLIFDVIVENADLAKIGKNTPWQMTLKAGFCHPYGHLKFPAPLKISKVAVILTLFKFIISL